PVLPHHARTDAREGGLGRGPARYPHDRREAAAPALRARRQERRIAGRRAAHGGADLLRLAARAVVTAVRRSARALRREPVRRGAARAPAAVGNLRPVDLAVATLPSPAAIAFGDRRGC